MVELVPPIPVDGQWKVVANHLAAALRRYTMVHEKRVEDSRIVCELKVPGDLHNQACRALDDLAQLVYEDSHREAERAAKKKAASKPKRSRKRAA